jgi:hypothetical protein
VVDVNVRKVTISRSTCDATEGRRFYYKDFNHQVNPTEHEWMGFVGNGRGKNGKIRGLQRTEIPSKLPTTLGLFDQDGSIQAHSDADDVPDDLWTTSKVRKSEFEEYEMGGSKKMSMPTCPFTIVLDTSPQEGTTVVVKVFEDPALAKHRDNELYFYEEPTFRAGVGAPQPQLPSASDPAPATATQTIPSDVAANCRNVDGTAKGTCEECEVQFPGSRWLQNHDGGSCFIQNVPYEDDADKTAYKSTGWPTGTALKFRPRGGKAIDVMFTDQDWDVPRRITVIALNDDVDEPTETRTIYFDTEGCTGKNHNTGTGTEADDGTNNIDVPGNRENCHHKSG